MSKLEKQVLLRDGASMAQLLLLNKAADLINYIDLVDNDSVLATMKTEPTIFEKKRQGSLPKVRNSGKPPVDFLIVEAIVDLRAELVASKPDYKNMLRCYLLVMRTIKL